jgi:putative xylitol transport system permease protein
MSNARDTSPAASSNSLRHHYADTALRLLKAYGIVTAFFVLCIVLSIVSDYFLELQNILNILRQTSINGILAIGMTFVILTRGIDLSVGSVAALGGIVAASFATTSSIAGMPGAPYWAVIAIAIGILTGVLAGGISGTVVSRFRVPPFVVTLGMLSIARGLTLLYSGGLPVPDLTARFRWIGTGEIFRIPVPIFILLIVYGVAWWVLARTRFGRHVYASGGNPRAATTSGISVSRVRLSVYVIAGALAGLAGILLAARTGSGLPQAGISYELDAIAAVVIGGTSLAGGIGGVTGTLFGALIIGVMNNGLDLLGVDSNYQEIFKGLMIVGAVMLDSTRRADTH